MHQLVIIYRDCFYVKPFKKLEEAEQWFMLSTKKYVSCVAFLYGPDSRLIKANVDVEIGNGFK